MTKTIHTPREELICGKLDVLFDLIKSINRADMAELVHDIRNDAQRMEAKLILRKDEVVKLQKQEWQPIESAPEDGTMIIGLDGNKTYPVVWNLDDELWCGAVDMVFIDGALPTHWMPLPPVNDIGDE